MKYRAEADRSVRRPFCFRDVVFAIMVVIPLSIVFTGLHEFHVFYFSTSFVGYFYLVRGMVRWRIIRWYAGECR